MGSGRIPADAVPTSWTRAREQIEAAEVWWITTVRGDGRTHVRPLLAVWQDDALHFCTGPTEQKARNLDGNANCALTTGVNTQEEGIDLVVQGRAARVTDEARLHRLADAWEAKYGADWRFIVLDGAFVHGQASRRSHDPGFALVFAVAPTSVLGFGKVRRHSQTRWNFGPKGPVMTSSVSGGTQSERDGGLLRSGRSSTRRIRSFTANTFQMRPTVVFM